MENPENPDLDRKTSRAITCIISQKKKGKCAKTPKLGLEQEEEGPREKRPDEAQKTNWKQNNRFPILVRLPQEGLK